MRISNRLLRCLELLELAVAEKVSIAAKTKLLLSVIKSLPLLENFLKRKITQESINKCFAQKLFRVQRLVISRMF